MRRIAQISDIHFGAEDPLVVEALRRDLLADPYDLLVVSGDFTQRARRRQFERAMDLVGPLPGQKLFVPGNHDIPLFDVVRRFLAPLSHYRRCVTELLTPVFRDEELLVIGLNTARPLTWTWDGFWKDGHISAEQLLDVHIECLETPAELFKVVVTHHPFIPPKGDRPHGIVHGATRALRTLEAVGVELLLAGHLHMNYSGDVRSHHEATQRSILSVQAGTACSVRRRNEPNAYNRITIESAAFDDVEHDRVTIRVRECPESGDRRFRDGAVDTFERHETGWRPTTPTTHTPHTTTTTASGDTTATRDTHTSTTSATTTSAATATSHRDREAGGDDSADRPRGQRSAPAARRSL